MRAHPVHIGELTEFVELRSRTLTADGTGGSTAVWAKYADVWAHIRPLTGVEREGAMRTESIGKYLVVLRNRSDVKEADVVRWGSRDMNVIFIRARGPRDLYVELETELGTRI